MEKKGRTIFCQIGIGDDPGILPPLAPQLGAHVRGNDRYPPHSREEDCMKVMRKAPNLIVFVEIQNIVIVRAVDLHLYDAFIHRKAGDAL